MRTLQSSELKEILIKNWMTHDAMWFYHCLQECGIEKTNRVNRAAARAVAMIEIKRIQKALGVDKVETFQDFRLLSDATWGIVKAEFMRLSYSYPTQNTLRVDFENCFAYEGMKQLGAIEQYQCGIFERICGWYEGLGIEYSVSPQVDGCMMHTDDRCFREITFTFDK
jgi:hypothetical protein